MLELTDRHRPDMLCTAKAIKMITTKNSRDAINFSAVDPFIKNPQAIHGSPTSRIHVVQVFVRKRNFLNQDVEKALNASAAMNNIEIIKEITRRLIEYPDDNRRKKSTLIVKTTVNVDMHEKNIVF